MERKEINAYESGSGFIIIIVHQGSGGLDFGAKL